MNEVKLRGRFLGASEIKEVGTQGTKIRQFWMDISDNPQYPNTPELQLINDKCVLVDNLTPGKEIEVNARLKGRKTADATTGAERVFTNIEAWRIVTIQRESAAFAAPSASTPPTAAPTTGTFAAPDTEGKKSGLPF